MSNDKDYTNVLLEDMASKMDAVLEIVGATQTDMKTLAKQADLEEVKADIRTIKAALADTNVVVKDHEHRITKLETSAA